MINRFYIFEPKGNMIFYQEWNVRSGTISSPSSDSSAKAGSSMSLNSPSALQDESIVEKGKLVFGVIYSLKNFVAKLSKDP